MLTIRHPWESALLCDALHMNVEKAWSLVTVSLVGGFSCFLFQLSLERVSRVGRDWQASLSARVFFKLLFSLVW